MGDEHYSVAKKCMTYITERQSLLKTFALLLVSAVHKFAAAYYSLCSLYLRIKPKKRLVREKPEPLAQPDAANQGRKHETEFSHPNSVLKNSAK